MVVVYNSQTNFTKNYAEAYAKSKGYECYSVKEAKGSVKKGASIAYFGNIKIGKISKYKKVNKRYLISTLACVGLDTDIIKREIELKELYKKTVFYFIGGIDVKNLKGIDKIIMKKVIKTIEKKYKENPTNNLKFQLESIKSGISQVDLGKLKKIY